MRPSVRLALVMAGRLRIQSFAFLLPGSASVGRIDGPCWRDRAVTAVQLIDQPCGVAARSIEVRGEGRQ